MNELNTDTIFTKKEVYGLRNRVSGDVNPPLEPPIPELPPGRPKVYENHQRARMSPNQLATTELSIALKPEVIQAIRDKRDPEFIFDNTVSQNNM